MPRIGVCSWSLRPASPEDLVEKLRACELSACQLALNPIREGKWNEQETLSELRAAGITILSGMIEMVGEDYSTLESIRATGGVRPARHWEANLRSARASAALAQRLGLGLVTFHAGFLPHDERDPERATLIARLSAIARAFADHGVRVALETGQERAETLVAILKELEAAQVGVNFDPANMILYGMGDPVAALDALAPWVRQVHVKDARPAQAPGAWGTEVSAGEGAVEWRRFLALARARRPEIDLVIERESGERRVEDVRAAKALLDGLVR